MTVNDIFENAIALVNGISDDGTVDITTTADFKARTPFLTNLLQMELIKTGDLTAKYEVSYSPMKNLLQDRLEILEHITTDIIYETAIGNIAKAYYFDSDASSGTVYIEDYANGWLPIATIPLVNSGLGMISYKGLVSPSVNATKTRIRFSGSFNYRYSNFGLFSNSFSDISKMFDYSPYVKITMPTTVHSIKEVIVETFPNSYEVVDDSKFEINGTTLSIFINRDFSGKIRIMYIPNPTKITLADLSETLQIDDYSCNIIAYGLAMNFMIGIRDDVMASMFKNKFDELKSLSQFKKPKSAKKIINKYGYF